LNGWGTITSIKQHRKEKIFEVKFDDDRITETIHYHSNGKLNLAHLHPAITEVRPQKWESKLGNFLLTIVGNIELLGHEELSKSSQNKLKTEAGMFQTLAQAQVARNYTKTIRRQLAWLFEHYPEEDGKWSEETMWTVFYDSRKDRYYPDNNPISCVFMTAVYMSVNAADHLAQELNSGRVEL
jgi:hypothetical protein